MHTTTVYPEGCNLAGDTFSSQQALAAMPQGFNGGMASSTQATAADPYGNAY